MKVLPSGTVTFLFTDIEGSTRLWESCPDEMREALTAHDRIVRSAIDRHGGYVFSTAGDAFSAAFWTPSDAVAAAVDAQRALATEAWPHPVAIAVRIGVHTGTAQERDGDYFGPALNRAARLMSAAHGGQILVSVATVELVRDRAPDGVTFLDLGEHALRDLARPERLFQVCGRGLAARFAPLHTETARPGNLPVSSTSFVGRSEELKRLAAKLTERGLVTLIGVGGVGKTRLAVEAGRMAADEFPDGVWYCELAPVADSDAVPAAVAATLLVHPREGLSMTDSLIDALRGRQLLVILDNCEHVLDAAATVARRMVVSSSTVTVLATSREPLDVVGEQVWPVASLIAKVEGVELFCERAAAADVAFTPVETEFGVIAHICERLDGIPLAIELAAARVRSMTPSDLAAGLSDRFRLLRGHRRGAVERHQTLRATVEWSYQLLSDAERLLFERLAVFAGGFDLATVEAVCAHDRVQRADVAELLGALVDKSMVVADRRGPHTRYRLLETLRQYGDERLTERGELAGLRDRHLVRFAELAEQRRQRCEGNAHTDGMRTFKAEWDDFRAAVHWAASRHDVGRGSTILRSLFFFAWFDVRHEIGTWAEQLLDEDPPDPVVYGVAAFFAVQRGEHDRGLDLARAGLAGAHNAGADGAWICWYAIALAYWYSGRVDEGWSAVRALNDVVDPVREPFVAAYVASTAAGHGAAVRDFPATEFYLDRISRIVAAHDNPTLDLSFHWACGVVAGAEGRSDTAADHYRLALEVAEQTENRNMSGIVRMSIAISAMNSPGATAALGDALTSLYAIRDWHFWVVLEAVALHWIRTGRSEPAAVLLGHLEAHDIRHGMFKMQRHRAVGAVRHLPEAHRWMGRGASLDRDQVVMYALAELSGADEPEPASRPPRTTPATM